MLRHKDYFEGILQLRNIDDTILKFAIKEIEKKENASIAKVKNVTNGYDIYMAPQRFLRNLGTKLQNQFGGQLIISKKLHTRNRLTSKEVYRVNALFRGSNYKKGDIINYKGEKVKIIGISKKVLAKDINTGKKLTLNFKDLAKYSHFCFLHF